MLNESQIELIDNKEKSEMLEKRKEYLKRLFVGFSNKQKVENLRFFII